MEQAHFRDQQDECLVYIHDFSYMYCNVSCFIEQDQYHNVSLNEPRREKTFEGLRITQTQTSLNIREV